MAATACEMVVSDKQEYAVAERPAGLSDATARVTYRTTLRILDTGLDARALALGVGRGEPAEPAASP
jgi:hypothetical protein